MTNEDLIYAGQIIELGERSKSMIDKVAPQEQAKPAESAPAAAQTAQKQTTYAANAAVTSAQSTMVELFYQMVILLENKDLMQLLVWLK